MAMEVVSLGGESCKGVLCVFTFYYFAGRCE